LFDAKPGELSGRPQMKTILWYSNISTRLIRWFYLQLIRFLVVLIP
jgi:hypothetical protein